MIIGAHRADGGPDNANTYAGEAYVVFGKASGFSPLFELSGLDGSNGFTLAGIDGFVGGPNLSDRAGFSVSSAGDVDGDGFADVIVGAGYADGGPGNARVEAGESYIVFGKASGFGSVVGLGELGIGEGTVIAGIDANDRAGRQVSSVGDVNGDGGQDGSPVGSGEAYVVFGRAGGLGTLLELSELDGNNGFLLAGVDVADYAGRSVSGAGDVNGDGLADLLIGAASANGRPGNPTESVGEAYVVFGKRNGFGPTFELSSLDGSNGFVLAGLEMDDQTGFAVASAGDVNGDGLSDIVVSAWLADGGPGNPSGGAGESYVVFGRTSGFSAVLDLSSLDGSDGFLLAGVDPGDSAGFSVSSAGDVNGDGIDDLVIGTETADGGPGNPALSAGESYVVFGRADGFGAVVDLGTLGKAHGILISGADELDQSGISVSSAGDVNGDGFGDLIVGSFMADGGPDNARSRAGESYVIFGSDFSGAVDQQGDVGDNTLTGDADANVLIGGQGNDTLIGNGGADVLYGGQGDDILAISDATLQRLKGGTGEDTLRLDGPGFALDLTLIADLRIGEIEAIDLQDGAGAHSLTLDVLEVLNISDTSNSLTIFGDGADTVAIGAGWTSQGVAGAFETFTQGAATLEIDTDIVVTA